MRKLWLVSVLCVFSVSAPAFSGEPKLHPLFPKKSSPNAAREGVVTGVRAVPDAAADPGRGIREKPARQAWVNPYFYGIDYEGRWILNVVGYMNYVPVRPVAISLEGRLAYLVVPQSSESFNLNPFIKTYDSTRFEYPISFERTGKYPFQIEVPGAGWKYPLQGWVLARPHGEIQSQCTSQQLVRTVLAVDWLEIMPQRILHTALSDGVTSVGDAQGFQAFRIRETGIWIAFYELDIPIAEYQQKVLTPLYPYRDITLTADTGDKVIMYDVPWGTPPFTPCSMTPSSKFNWDVQ